MSRWREVGQQETGSRIELAPVLDHYGVRYMPGRNEQMVPCPMHEDRTPSLSVNLAECKFLCHSCGLAGNTGLTLIIQKEGVDVAGGRAIAATLGLSEGEPGGGDEQVLGSAYGSRNGARRGPVAQGSRDRRGNGRWVPPWRSG